MGELGGMLGYQPSLLVPESNEFLKLLGEWRALAWSMRLALPCWMSAIL
jgi:hypothetical protein